MTHEEKADHIKEFKEMIEAIHGEQSTLLVETGTFVGDMVNDHLDVFDYIISIELSFELFCRSSIRFKYNDKVLLAFGSSPVVLKTLLPQIKKQPVIYWLDAHYSGGETAGDPVNYPVIEELKIIFDNKNTVKPFILIDDYLCLMGLEEQIKDIAEKNGYRYFVYCDTIIELIPNITK